MPPEHEHAQEHPDRPPRRGSRPGAVRSRTVRRNGAAAEPDRRQRGGRPRPWKAARRACSSASSTTASTSRRAIHPRSATAQAVGVDGLAHGRDVHLARASSPDASRGHGAGARARARRPAATGRRGGVATNEADAHAVAAHPRPPRPPCGRARPAPGAARPRGAALRPALPPHLDRAGTGGLGLHADEIGMIYAANWERDLSQAHPALGNVIVAWKSVKLAAFEKRLTEGDMAHFQGACQAVLESAIDSIRATGGTDAFLDRPPTRLPALRAHGQPRGDPAGRADEGRARHEHAAGSPAPCTSPASTSRRCSSRRPALASRARGHADRRGGRSSDHPRRAGAGPGTPTAGGIPANSVAQETSLEVQGKTGARGGGVTTAGLRAVGRASHALQDFWSHSNFVERAIGDPDFRWRPDDGDVRRRRQVARARAQDPRRGRRDRRRDAADRPHDRADRGGPGPVRLRRGPPGHAVDQRHLGVDLVGRAADLVRERVRLVVGAERRRRQAAELEVGIADSALDEVRVRPEVLQRVRRAADQRVRLRIQRPPRRRPGRPSCPAPRARSPARRSWPGSPRRSACRDRRRARRGWPSRTRPPRRSACPRDRGARAWPPRTASP